MSASDRIREWAKYPIVDGVCREHGCKDNGVADTPAGLYCLAHYVNLRGCCICGAATDEYVAKGEQICARCQDGHIEIILVSSPLKYLDETPGHENMCVGPGSLKGLTKKMRKLGMKIVSPWPNANRRSA